MSSDLHQPPPQNSPEQSARAARLRLLLPVLVVIGAAAIAAWLLQTGPKAKPRATVRNPAIVDVRPVVFGPQASTVSIMGTVMAQQEVVLKPQVSGKIIALSDRLVPGGFFAKGDPLLTIDPSDYQLAAQQLASEVARVEADRQIELGRQRVAQKEYELLGEPVSAEEKSLMLREPQLANLTAVLDATRARLAKAHLDLERTVVRAPFNAVVIARDINLGASVAPGTSLATLAGSDLYWVEAPVPAAQLGWIDTRPEGGGSPARIFNTPAWSETSFRSGRVAGLTATVEENGRMAKLLIEIPDPLALQPASQGQPKLLLGSYVRAEIAGTTLPHAARIERHLIRDGSHVWIMDDQDTLDIRPVEIAFRGEDHVLVSGGMRAGEQLIISNLPSPVQGMSLRLKGAAAVKPGDTGEARQ